MPTPQRSRNRGVWLGLAAASPAFRNGGLQAARFDRTGAASAGLAPLQPTNVRGKARGDDPRMRDSPF
ncbi:protein of unassigned function [Methylobacterium oryzae CBMB20]|uniref:Protein of unassigned function n=1 Tax=Methylobacterium oryzae CBMB20 TaxID=693986 RepID=A0A089QA97_9HYPH|nr:protein of unassigned function [Methylobacterium oryzae CBMB20]